MKKSAAPKPIPGIVPLCLDPEESVYLRKLVGPRLAAWGFDTSKALTIMLSEGDIESAVTGLLDEAVLEANLPMTMDFLSLHKHLEDACSQLTLSISEVVELRTLNALLSAGLIESDILREQARREVARLSGMLHKYEDSLNDALAGKEAERTLRGAISEKPEPLPTPAVLARPASVEATLSKADAALVASGRRLEEALRRGRTEYSESGRFELQKRDREGGGTEYQPAPIGAKLGDRWEKFLRVERDRNGFGWNETPIAKTGIETSRPYVPGVPRGLGALESLTKLGKSE